jgi:hypothetical protein
MECPLSHSYPGVTAGRTPLRSAQARFASLRSAPGRPPFPLCSRHPPASRFYPTLGGSVSERRSGSLSERPDHTGDIFFRAVALVVSLRSEPLRIESLDPATASPCARAPRDDLTHAPRAATPAALRDRHARCVVHEVVGLAPVSHEAPRERAHPSRVLEEVLGQGARLDGHRKGDMQRGSPAPRPRADASALRLRLGRASAGERRAPGGACRARR